ncbi:tRNA lysidine(34) synthetase TilS [Noviherbaspirillum sp. Root189]|uniref:tRNA lysidine(34) synthetase TilS n=1 Tax=Noviherbaspirillum sp. Root189 TaxID=1736487 RepID=UPI00070F8352|nr:tRNA lysidine(34) synthetase TilS [Noviherbaspirillum sp. Root189]KRB84468.1 tRNA(Ile)-lysidine synthase [Noviherbaspirillum sp. Root189]
MNADTGTASGAPGLQDVFERALGAILARVVVSTDGAQQDTALTNRRTIAVAYSGGLDSAVLLQLAHGYAQSHGLVLYAFHIHHGLSPNADAWSAHCEKQCASAGVHFSVRRVELTDRHKQGTEQAARISRYAALGELCREQAIPVLLTAHHRDDQAETVLLQLLRGSGVAGLSGMEMVNTAPSLVGDDALLIGRPLLDISRQALEGYAAHYGIAHVDDESNSDPRYARNALRHKVMPVLEAHFPGFQQRFARSAQHAQSAQRLLNELAAQDLAACAEGANIRLSQLGQLTDDRIDNVLRYWFALRGVRMPATAWLSEMREQLFGAKEDARIRVTHADCEIRRHRDRVFLTPRQDDTDLDVPPAPFRWNNEAAIRFPQFRGTLHFEYAEEGVDAEWLRAQALELRLRSGGERLKPAANRSTRSLKYHYQALDIPHWQRLRLPVVTTDTHLVFAAGIGMHWISDVSVEANSSHAGQAIRLRWEHDHT